MASVLNDSSRYFQLIALVFDGGTTVAKKLTLKISDEKCVDDYLKDNIDELKCALKKKNIFKEQMDILFPSSTTTTDLECWDISLFSYILLNVFDDKLESAEKVAIRTLRSKRNDLGHSPSTKMSEEQFWKEWGHIITRALLPLITRLDTEEQTQINIIFGKILTQDVNSVIVRLKSFSWSDEILDDVIAKLETHDNNVIELSKRVVELETFTDKAEPLLELTVKRLAEVEDKVKILLDIKARIVVDGSSPSARDTALEKLLNGFKTYASGIAQRISKRLSTLGGWTNKQDQNNEQDQCREQDQDDDDEVQTDIDNFSKDMRDQGVEIVEVEPGSIVITFRCPTISALKNISKYLFDRMYEERLMKLENSLSECVKSPIKLNISIVLETLHSALMQIEKAANNKSIVLTLQCRGSEGVKNAIDCFGNRSSTNALNSLSESLSKSVDSRIELHTTIDVAQLENDIEELEQQSLVDDQHSVQDTARRNIKTFIPMTTIMDPVIISPKNKSQARRIIQELLREKLLSLDSEGVQLGKDWPLTLVQIGTLDGRVYLFDVMLNERKQDKSFFKDTGLESILTSPQIVKVIHSCAGDSAALFHQFGVRLQNVFDTQVAHLVIMEDKGMKLPSRLKLAEICAHYSEKAEVYEDKDKLKMQWCKLVGNFWAIRPMTDTMKQYASYDVTALIPEVYDTQKKYIMDKGLYETYQHRVLEEIELVIDPEQKERRNKRNQDIRVAILTDMEKKCPDSMQFVSITDPDEKKAIEDTRPGEMDAFSGKMKRLKQESMITYMEEIEQELLTPESFNPHRSVWYKLGEAERHGTETAMKKANGLKQRLSEMILQDIETKYAPDTPLQCLNSLDCQVLKTIRPTGNQDQAFSQTILSLHWRLVEQDLDDETEKTKGDAEYEVHTSFGKLKFFISNDKVPTAIKSKATALKDVAEKRVLQSIPQKYTEDSDIEDLSGNERAVLGTLQVGRNQYHRVVVALHWKLTYERLFEDLRDVLAGELRINDGLKRKLNFLRNNSSVPRNVKEKAMEILSRTSSGRR